jgi:hypothetical protein
MTTPERQSRTQLRTLLYCATALALSLTACSTDASPSSLFQTIADWRLAEDIAKRLVGVCPVLPPEGSAVPRTCPPDVVPMSDPVLVVYDVPGAIHASYERDALSLDPDAFRETVLARASFTGDYRIEHEGVHTILRMKTRVRGSSEVSEIVLVIHRGKVVGALIPREPSSR